MPSILQVAGGLVFLFLLLSLIVTAVQEFLAALLKLRARNLRKAIRNLVQDPAHPNLAATLYRHPLVNSLSGSDNLPAYVSSRAFASALLEATVLGQGPGDALPLDQKIANLGDKSVIGNALGSLARDCKGDLDTLKARVEIWYNDAMDRAAGWYKRQTQWLVLGISVAVCGLLNADTLQLWGKLARDPATAITLLEKAEKFQPAMAGGSPAHPEAGPDPASARLVRQWQEAGNTDLLRWDGAPAGLYGWTLKLLGLLITVFAISLGAPFWFDILNRFMNIRAAGKAPEEEPKKPREDPAARAAGETVPPSPRIEDEKLPG